MTTRFSIMMTGALPMSAYGPLAATVEALGFDELHIADDLIFRPAWPILALAAQATTRIRLGPAIVTPQVAHPVYHAANLAALDELSGGRAVFGIGRGGFNQLLGIERQHSMQILREAVAMVRRMLAGERSAVEGRFFRASPDLFFQFEPVRREIPLFIGTWGPKISELAGEIASGIKADCTWNPDYLAQLRQRLHAGAGKAGRDPATLDLTVGPLCSIAEDRDAAERAARRMLALLLPFLAPMTAAAGITEAQIDAASGAMLRGDEEAAIAAVPAAAVRAFCACGTPGDIIAQVRDMVAAGATHVAFGPPLGPDVDVALDLLGRQVLPALRASQGPGHENPIAQKTSYD